MNSNIRITEPQPRDHQMGANGALAYVGALVVALIDNTITQIEESEEIENIKATKKVENNTISTSESKVTIYTKDIEFLENYQPSCS